MFGWLQGREIRSIKSRIELGNYNFREAPDWVKNNRDLVLLAVGRDWNNLKYAAEEFKDDEEIVRLAISKNAYAVQFASKPLREKSELMEIAIKKNGYMFMFAEGELKSDLNLVKLALSGDESAAVHISKEAMKKPKFVLSILSELRPKYIPKEFLQKKKFLMKALPLNLDVFHEIPVDAPIRADKDIRYQCYKILYDFTKDLIDWEKKSEENIIEYVISKLQPTNNHKIFYFVHPCVNLKKEFILKLMRDYGAAFYECIQDDSLKNDRDIVKEALSILPELIVRAVPRAPFDFTNCKEIAFIGLQKKPNLITYYKCRFDIDVIKFAIEIDPNVLYLLPCRYEKDMIIFAISKGLQFTSSHWDASIINDESVALAFVKQTNGEVLSEPKFPQHFRKDLEFAKSVFFEIEYDGDFFDEEVRIEATCRHKKSAKK